VVVGVSSTAQGVSVNATFDVDKTGQMISAREALFWDNEIAGLDTAVSGQAVALSSDAQASTASRENVLSIGVLSAWLLVAVAASIAIYLVLPRPLRPVGRLVLPIGAILISLRLWSRFQGRLDTKAAGEDGKLPPPPVEPS
jgi:hypothetical protein